METMKCPRCGSIQVSSLDYNGLIESSYLCGTISRLFELSQDIIWDYKCEPKEVIEQKPKPHQWWQD